MYQKCLFAQIETLFDYPAMGRLAQNHTKNKARNDENKPTD